MNKQENSSAAFVNNAVMDDEEFLNVADGQMTPDSVQPKQKQTLFTAPEEDGAISNLQSDRWKKLSCQIRGAMAVKNAVRHDKKRSSRKSTANIDPFLQKFSTREISLTTQASRVSSQSIAEEKPEYIQDEDVVSNYENRGLISTYLGLTCSPTKIIDPDGSFLYYWQNFLITAIRYNFWVIILRFAFLEAQENYASLWWILDTASDVVYVLDIVINSRVGFVDEGILIKDWKRAYQRYLKSPRFFLDVLSVLPLELLYFQTGIQPILRLPRLLKTYKSQEIESRLEGRANHPTIVRVFCLIHLMFLIIHWNAGIYFLISRAEGFGSDEWVYSALNGSYDTLTRKYVRSFYWSALTLTTIGDLPSPVTNIEYVYTIACYLSGVFMFAMIVGNAGSIILNSNASRLEFERQRDNAKNYMEIHNVPGELQRRVLKWYDYSWSRGRMGGEGGDLNSLHLLPDKMKTEIALHVHLETLKKVTFLQNCEPEFLHELLLKMKLHIFTPGDIIIRHGEIAREMYLITHGRIEVISETGTILKELGSGDFFGEIGILSLSEGQNRRTADVRSIGYTECFVLSKDDVLGEIQEFPQAQRILAEYGRKRLQNTSGDPRLVTLDNSEPPSNKENPRQTKLHVVEIVTEKSENDQDDNVKYNKRLNQDGRANGSNKEHRQITSALFKATKKLVAPALVNQKGSNECIGDALFGDKDKLSELPDKDGKDGGQSHPTRDLNQCLNALEDFKVVLQSIIDEETRKHKDHISWLECELAIQEGKVNGAEQKIKTQKDEISELRNVNKILEQNITERENKIAEMENALQRDARKVDPEIVNLCNLEAVKEKTDTCTTVMLNEDNEDLGSSTSLLSKKTKVTFCDTTC